MPALRPSRRALSVTVGQVWAWTIVWGIVAFLPTPFGAWPDATFYAALAAVVCMGASLTVTAAINRKHSRSAN